MIKQEEVLTFCRMCFGRCSLVMTAENGKVIRVTADKEAPPGRDTPCIKGLALPQILYHPDRLIYPQRREGPKGSGKWVRISWEEALSTIIERLGNLRDEFGPESLALGLGDPKGLELAFAQRFASAYGTPNITTPGHICHMPGVMAETYTFGSPCVPDDAHHPNCIVVWGSNPTATRNGLSPVQLRTAFDAGAKLIVIDPRRTDLASRADIWIRPRPGSDGILAMGIIKVIIEDRLFDNAFITGCTSGFNQIKEHTKTFSLQEVEQITWVPMEQVIKAARLYANNRPGTILTGNALDHSPNSFQTLRAICIIRALSGNVDVPGGDTLTSPPSVTSPGKFMLLKEFPRNRNRTAGGEFKLAARSAFIPRQSLIKAILEEEPGPIKALILFGSNPLLTYPNAERTYQALMKLDFLVVAELFMTPTAELADIVLPAAAFCEFDEIFTYPSHSGNMLLRSRVVPPPGECWSDIKMINRLARKAGLGKHFWDDENEALDLILGPSGQEFIKLKQKRVMGSEKRYGKYQDKGLRTPSGTVEILSKQAEDMGYSPMPLFDKLSFSVRVPPKLAEEYPLLLTSAKERYFVHSGLRNIDKLRKTATEPTIELNPDMALELGLREGDWVLLETPRGKIKQRLSLNDHLDSRVVVASYAWWFPEDDISTLHGWIESNINVLTESGPPYDPGLGSLCLRGIPCRISTV
ncbi:molybdopterin-dependent oxidoreductase [Chloroflexota bacterium]